LRLHGADSLRVMAKLRALAHLIGLSRLVHERRQFVARQALRRPVLGRYSLRGSGLPFFVRHATPDVNTFEQMFHEGHYELPAPVAAALPARGTLTAVDLGANIGMFGLWLRTRFPAARITAFEPDPSNAAVLRQTAQANSAAADWDVIEAAAGNRDGEVSFLAGDFTNSRIATEDEAGTTVALVDAFPYIEAADFVKVDIEGAEWQLTGDSRFAALRAAVIAFEYHLADAGDDPRAQAIGALERAGYQTMEGELDALPGHGMIWAWRSR
jgi:FkbM family methyltransferase